MRLIRIVRFVKNVVEWRKQVAGKSCRKLCRVSDRIGYGLGSGRELGKESDPNWNLAQRSLARRKAMLVKLGIGST